MDPDVVLAELRIQATAVIDAAAFPEISDGYLIFVERFRALDDWLAEGGFLPKPWKDAK